MKCAARSELGKGPNGKCQVSGAKGQVAVARPVSANAKMKRLWEISVRTTPEAEEAVTELLESLFSQTASSYTNLETGKVIASVFLSTKPRHFRASLLGGLARIKQCRLDPGVADFSVKRVQPRNWAESWKRHFKPIEISSALLIQPSWSKRRPQKRQAVVILDPGLSFGTGQHPTTVFCLQQLVNCRDRGRQQSFLDVGSGSGILAIAAAKLGYKPVEALDSDPEAVRIARGNARRNRVFNQVRIRSADLTTLPTRGAPKHDLVCANLTSDLLLAERQRIVSRLKPEGGLVLAGILKAEFPRLVRAYRSAGLKLVKSQAEKGWQSAAFLRR